MTALHQIPRVEQLYFGSVPVPYTAAWSGEEQHGMIYLGQCPYARRAAICQHWARGEGKPRFGSPHMERQRQVIALALCDLCGKPLKNRTKVSLSKARPQPHAARAMDVLQVEPLLHKECAAISMQHCPSLRADIRNGTVCVRQVFRHACQFALYSEQGTFEATGERKVAVSHAKVQLVTWRDRDADWLERAAA